MTSLNDEQFLLDEHKVWFTGGYWPEGVPKQLKDVEDVEVLPMHEGFIKSANDNETWDKDVCIFCYGPYMERVKLRTLFEYAKRFGTYLYDTLEIRKGDVVAIDLPNQLCRCVYGLSIYRSYSTRYKSYISADGIITFAYNDKCKSSRFNGYVISAC